MLAARIRQWGFSMTDLLQGSPIGGHCEDIEARLATGAPSEDRLEAILGFAVAHAPFYAACRGFSTLQDFPVIDKQVIKAHPEAFRSDVFRNARLQVMHTSGSTGTPLAVLQDPDKRRRALAEMICFGRKAGYQVGDRYVFTRVWNRLNRKPWHVALRENAVMFDISSLDEARLEALRALLRSDTDIRCLLGYPSTLGPLVKHLERCGDGPECFHLRTVISISERLPHQLREALRARFGCTVVARYSNQENGVLAQQCPDRDEYHLNTASYFFEYLSLDGDRPAGPGERARMVVTDLFNRAMPLIRYDTGDVVLRQPGAACGGSPETLREIEGRRMDFLYDTEDRRLSPVVVCNAFWPFTGLKQFQLVQEARGRYTLVLNGTDPRATDESLATILRGFLGAGAAVTVRHVDQIPQLASGKFSVVVNHHRPSA